jgi:hypothetical protein
MRGYHARGHHLFIKLQHWSAHDLPHQVKAVIPRLLQLTSNSRNPLGNLWPAHVSQWWPLVEDAPPRHVL